MIRRLLKLIALLGFALTAIFSRTPQQSGSQPPARERSRLKRWLLPIGVFLVAAGCISFLVVVLGVVPIKASSGHWAVTRWFLNFAKERSVATHSLGLKPPRLEADWRVLMGAAHYETGCRPCHGAPGTPLPRIPFGMTPTPPRLAGNLARFDDEELFYIVKHGIKFTGMPAWPAKHRDDEVWSMVAFLRELPGMDARKYRQLALGEGTASSAAPVHDMLAAPQAPDAVRQSCARCHGFDGLGRENGAFPKLAGQRPDYLYKSLQAYARGERHSGIMEPIAAGLPEETLGSLAEYYSSLPPGIADAKQHQSEAIDRGRSIAADGIQAQGVAACAACHGPAPTEHNSVYPVLFGQDPDYLVSQLELFSKKQRGGTEYSHLMHFTAAGLKPNQRRDVALYYASLLPNPAEQQEAHARRE